MYILPYTTSLLIFDIANNELATKTFKPGDFLPQTDIVNTDVTSEKYNSYRIQEYINKGYFSNVALSTTVGVPGGPVTPGNGTIETISDLFFHDQGWDMHGVYNIPYKRNDLITWIEYQTQDGPTDYWVRRFDTNTNTFTASPFSITVTEEIWASNFVIKSDGSPAILFYTSSEGATDAYLAYVDPITFAVDLTVATSRRLTGLNINNTNISNLMVDEEDTLFFANQDGIYRINPTGPVTKIIDQTNIYATYDTLSQRFYLLEANDGNTLQSFDKLGNPIEYSPAGSSIQFAKTETIVAAADWTLYGGSRNHNPIGLYVYTWPLFGQDGSLQVTGNLETDSFLDGPIQTGQITEFSKFVMTYETTNDIYFIDQLHLTMV